MAIEVAELDYCRTSSRHRVDRTLRRSHFEQH